MGTKAVQRGPTADTVAANVNRLRKQQNLGLRALAARLADTGRPLTHTALDKIERGTRRVDVDDLMALAAALYVSPATLLMPGEVPLDKWDQSTASVTGVSESISPQSIWKWVTAQASPDPSVGAHPMWVARSVPEIFITMRVLTDKAIARAARKESHRGND